MKIMVVMGKEMVYEVVCFERVDKEVVAIEHGDRKTFKKRHGLRRCGGPSGANERRSHGAVLSSEGGLAPMASQAYGDHLPCLLTIHPRPKCQVSLDSCSECSRGQDHPGGDGQGEWSKRYQVGGLGGGDHRAMAARTSRMATRSTTMWLINRREWR